MLTEAETLEILCCVLAERELSIATNGRHGSDSSESISSLFRVLEIDYEDLVIAESFGFSMPFPKIIAQEDRIEFIRRYLIPRFSYYRLKPNTER